MPLVHLSPYCQQQNCPIAASSSSSSTTPLMSSYSTPAPSSSSSNTCSDPNNMITHTTISLRKRRMPCQRRRKTHYCYGCEAKVWVHLHSDTLVPICHRCLGAFVVAIREGSSASVQAAPASARHHHHHHHPLPTPPTPPASAATTTTTSVSPNICTQDPSSHVSLFERLVHCFPIKRTTTATTTTCPVPRPLDYNDVCPICYDTLVSQHEQPVHLAPCMHTFHRACIEQWILGYKTTCPYCCQPTSLSRIQAIDTMH